VVLVYGGFPDGEPGPLGDYSLVLDTWTGEYEQMPYHTVLPSPTGTRLLAIVGDGSPDFPIQFKFLDRSSTGGVSLALPGQWHDPQWSPDGSTVLISNAMPIDGAPGFELVTAATITTSPFVPVPQVRTDNALGLGFSFTADATGVLFVHSQGSGNEADGNVRLTTVDHYTLDGTLVESVPLAIDRVRWATVSADGARIWAVRSPDEAGNSSLVVLSTVDGSVVSTIEGVPIGPVEWADNEVAVMFGGSVYSVDGALIGRVPTHPDAGASNADYESVVLGRVADLPAAAAQHAF
jgi:hypothetical protein